MTDEEKQLLLLDLCARFPYGVVARDMSYTAIANFKVLGIKKEQCLCNDYYRFGNKYDSVGINYVKPYLRPMSSMTEEEKKELWVALDKDMDIIENNLDAPTINVYKGRVYRGNPVHYELDFLISHHFDYRGLIEKGLALEAPEGMYNFKSQDND